MLSNVKNGKISSANGGNCDDEKNYISGYDFIDGFFNDNQMTEFIETVKVDPKLQELNGVNNKHFSMNHIEHNNK